MCLDCSIPPTLILVSSCFHLFGPMKDELLGQDFLDNTTVIFTMKAGSINWLIFLACQPVGSYFMHACI